MLGCEMLWHDKEQSQSWAKPFHPLHNQINETFKMWMKLTFSAGKNFLHMSGGDIFVCVSVWMRDMYAMRVCVLVIAMRLLLVVRYVYVT